MAKSDWVSQIAREVKPWGPEDTFGFELGKYCGKILYVKAGGSLSLHYHNIKEETIAVQSGRARIQVGPDIDQLEEFELLPGEAIHIVPGTRHRTRAVEDSILLEVSTTELEDHIRLEDLYGRAGR